MVPMKDEMDEHLLSLLYRLRKVAPLNPQAVSEERSKFLAQGKIFRAAVSQQQERRHIGWINTLILAFQRKERKPMLNALMAIVISVVVLFGGAGATVYAAQGSLPDQPLYQVKTWSEDARLALTGSTQQKLDLNLEFTDRRVVEAVKLQAAGKAVPEGVVTRLQQELEAALQIAAGMNDPQLVQALAQIRQEAESQLQTVASAMGGALKPGDPTMARLQERLQEQVQLAAAGEADPQGFRLEVRNRHRQNQPTPIPQPTQPGSPTHMPINTPAPTGTSYGPGPGAGQPSGTPGQYGPGEPNPSRTPEPTGGSYGPGPGTGQPTGTPGGYGPGPHAGTVTCTPVHDGGGPGPGPMNPSATPQAGNPGGGNGQATATPEHGGNGGGNGQSTATPGQGGNGGGNGQSTATPQGGGGGQGGQPTDAPGGGGGKP